MDHREHLPDQGGLAQQCRAAVDRLLAHHDWHLLEREALTERALAQLRAGLATDPGRAAVYTYSLALYHACSGMEGAERQNRGYTELFHYLYDRARRRDPQVAEDATQRALEAIFRRFGYCQQPGAFLAFAMQHLLDATRALRRQEDQQPQSLAMPVGAGDDTLGALLPDPRPVDPGVDVLSGEGRARLNAYAAQFVRKHPRAVQQFAALWLKYVDGLDDVTIGRQLGKPINSVYVLRSRAIAKLQADAAWRSLAREWDLLPDTLEAVAVGSACGSTTVN